MKDIFIADGDNNFNIPIEYFLRLTGQLDRKSIAEELNVSENFRAFETVSIKKTTKSLLFGKPENDFIVTYDENDLREIIIK